MSNIWNNSFYIGYNSAYMELKWYCKRSDSLKLGRKLDESLFVISNCFTRVFFINYLIYQEITIIFGIWGHKRKSDIASWKTWIYGETDKVIDYKIVINDRNNSFYAFILRVKYSIIPYMVFPYNRCDSESS